MKSTIYALCNTKTKEIRYIGKTVQSLLARYRRHAAYAKSGSDLYVHRWWRSLSEPPTIIVIEEVPRELSSDAEIRHIAEHKRNGARLTNLTDGGDGMLGRKHSDEHKEHMRSLMKGRVISQEARAKMSAAKKGKPRSEGAVAKQSKTLTGRKRPAFSQEWLQNIGNATRGRRHSEETKARISASGVGRKMPPKSVETLQRMSDAQRGKRLTAEHRAKISIGLARRHEENKAA